MSWYVVIVILAVGFNLAPRPLDATGDRPTMTSVPDKPTSVAIGKNVSLAWRFYLPRHLKVQEITFGIWKNPGYLSKKLVAVNSHGFSIVRRGFENKVIWAGNVTSSAVFILHNAQPTDGTKEFGVHIEFGLHHQPLTDSVRLLVKEEVSLKPAKITHVSSPGLLDIGDTVILDCTASGLPPAQVTWYKGGEVQANGISTATFTLLNISSNDWDTCICVAKNTDGKDQKIVLLKVRPESPTILNRNTTVHNPSWTLRWTAVHSEGMLVTLYTVWHRVLHVIDGEIQWREPWQRQNITGVKYHTELVPGTWYNLGVTAWNKWGESLLNNDSIITVVANVSELEEKATALLQTEEPVTSRSLSGSRTEPHVTYDVYAYGGGSGAIFVFVIIFLVKYIKRRKADRRKQFSKGAQDNEGISRMPSISSEQQDNESPFIATQRSLTDVSVQSVGFSFGQSTASQINVLDANDQLETSMFLLGNDDRPTQMGTSPEFICQKNPKYLKTFLPHSRCEKSHQTQEIYEDADMNTSPVVPAKKSKERDWKRTVFEGTTVETVQKHKTNTKNYEEENEVSEIPSRSCREKSETQTEELISKHTEVKDRVLACGLHRDVTDPDGYLRPADENFSYSENKNVKSNNSRPATLPFLPRKKSRENILEEGNYNAKSIWKHFTLGNKPSASNTRLHEQPSKTVNQRCRRFKHIIQSEGRNSHEGNPTSQSIHSYQNENFRTAKRCPKETNLLSSKVSSSKQQGSLEGEPHYTCVRDNVNWEIPPERLTLFSKIGGGAFGEVWNGVARDVGDTHGWSVVAIKMLKENSSKADLRDLLSELDLLKKLESHPNVIRFLGCVTKDTVLCQEKRLGPPLVILEFVPHGDLLGYLMKSRGERDNYYNLKGAEVSREIETRQLYSFALDIASGMTFIASKQLIHRDLAARNVLVGDGLRCKITDFGMARDLGKTDIYIRRSNGLMPIKWMACESLTSQVFTIESDVWSYGIVLYEIFTLGKQPYEGMSGEDVMHFITSGKRLPRIPNISSELYDVMLQCWKKEPVERPTFKRLASIMETFQTEAVPQVSSSQHK